MGRAIQDSVEKTKIKPAPQWALKLAYRTYIGLITSRDNEDEDVTAEDLEAGKADCDRDDRLTRDL